MERVVEAVETASRMIERRTVLQLIIETMMLYMNGMLAHEARCAGARSTHLMWHQQLCAG